MCGVDDIGEGFDVEIDGRLDEFGGGRGGGQAEPVSGGDTQGAGGTVTATRYYSEGGATVAVRTNGGKQWLAADHQGSADLTINTTTATVQRRWYNPYGDNRATQGTWPTDRGFLDQQTNASTGLIYDGAREYDPVLGSFISADPLTDPGNPTNFNAYAYAGHNPITASDPSGLRYDSDVSGGDPDNGGFAITSGLFDMYERIYGKVPPRVEAANHAFRKVYERITSHRAPPHGPGGSNDKDLHALTFDFVVPTSQPSDTSYPSPPPSICSRACQEMPINHKPSECDAACTREQAAVVVLLATTAGFAVLDAAFGVGDAENGEADINGLVVDEGKVVSAEANAAGDATAANESRGLNAADLKYSKTVQNHLDDLTAATGSSPARMSRPYMDSNAIIQSVMDGSEPGPDDVPGWLRWSTPGMYNNTKGVWQLVVDPESSTIYHFVFVGGK